MTSVCTNPLPGTSTGCSWVAAPPLSVLPQDLGRCLSAHLTLGPQTIHVHHSSCLLLLLGAVELCPLSHGWGVTAHTPTVFAGQDSQLLALPGPHLLSHTDLGMFDRCLTVGMAWVLTWGHLCGVNWEHRMLSQKLHCCFFCLLLFSTVWSLFLVSKKEHWPQKEWVYEGMYLTKFMKSRWWKNS